MADQRRALGAGGVDQPHQISGQGGDVIGLHGLRARRTAVTALVRRHDVIARSSQRGDLVAPGIGQFWEAVGQDHQRSARGPASITRSRTPLTRKTCSVGVTTVFSQAQPYRRCEVARIRAADHDRETSGTRPTLG